MRNKENKEMKKTVKIGFLMILLAFVVTACATGSINTPLPQTLSIEQPTPGTPKEIADYIGVWEGVWSSESQGYYHENVLPVTIVIEQIKSSRVRAIYSWGNWGSYVQEGWRRMSGEIKDGTITLSGYGTITIKIASNSKTASATMRSSNFRAEATLHKKDPKDLQLGAKRDIAHLPEKIRAYHGTWEGEFETGIPITEDIEVKSEKTATIIHSWGENPSRPHIKAGSWTLEAEFRDGYFYAQKENRIFKYTLTKNGTLVISTGPIDKPIRINGDLKKVE